MKMQKLIIRVEVEGESGKKVSGYKEDEWNADIPLDTVLETVFDAIEEIC